MREIRNVCPMCRKETRMEVSDEQFAKWLEYQYGAGLIQDIFPDLNPMEREYLKTGYCPDCQRKLFGTRYMSERITAV